VPANTQDTTPAVFVMNTGNDNAGGYPSSNVMKPYLEGGFLTGLIAALGHDYMYAVRRYISNKGSYTELNAKIFLPTEIEVYGMQINGDELGDTAAARYPAGRFRVVVLRCQRLW
jgi:hypothetical protein